MQVAQVIKQQAAAAGVTVNLKEVTSSEFFGPNYLSWTFAQDYWNYYPYFSNVLQGTLAGAPFNECHTNNAAYTGLYKQAVATLDEAKRRTSPTRCRRWSTRAWPAATSSRTSTP